MDSTLTYQTGFNNYHQTEAILGALPKTQNSPQKAPFGLYAEQLSGSAFTTPRDQTRFSWCYRLLPSVVHKPFVKFTHDTWQSPPYSQEQQSPNQYRWSANNLVKTSEINFIMGIQTIAGFGSCKTLSGATANIFYANKAMSIDNIYFSNHDAELLIVMQSGSALFTTEFGKLIVTCDNNHSEIIVIPRGIRFKVDPITDDISGYMAENYGNPLQLPELGPIGANSLANPRHFLYPTASYEQALKDTQHIKNIKWLCKYQGSFFTAELKSSPCNIVAWHGNYAPYKYNLDLFNTINTVSFDHPDPSIFTVLTSPSEHSGVANLDFVIFPPRWMVAENTFRPPYFHRNIMSEFMGLIKGEYDAKKDGFTPGSCSIHNRMSPHGPDYTSLLAAEEAALKPQKYENTLAFMFESNMAWDVTDYALNSSNLQKNYFQCWQDIPIRLEKKHLVS
ncbi:MAG: homogentisate 1,2-dioxygenase [Gammaproteobacteria bacterium]|nr:homogentisate 1,2-dioxygenase [Gammaproteobacteria bacterium]